MIDLICRYRALGARNADALEEFFPVELFTGAGALDDERGGEYGALVSGEPLTAVLTFTTAAYTPTTVMCGIDHSRLVFLTIRTEQLSLQILYSLVVPAYVTGLRAAMFVVKS